MGFRTQAEEDALETMSLDEYLIENKEATFMMRASGDSMRGEGIFRGDLLIVDRSRSPHDGNIVIAVHDGAFRMARFDSRIGGAGPVRADLAVGSELSIEAVVTAVIRKLV
ncbi:MAG TPA: S24 family peptidase [Candidatus Paceibacterota bacterium]